MGFDEFFAPYFAAGAFGVSFEVLVANCEVQVNGLLAFLGACVVAVVKTSLAKTSELLKQEQVIIYEAAFHF